LFGPFDSWYFLPGRFRKTLGRDAVDRFQSPRRGRILRIAPGTREGAHRGPSSRTGSKRRSGSESFGQAKGLNTSGRSIGISFCHDNFDDRRVEQENDKFGLFAGPEWTSEQGLSTISPVDKFGRDRPLSRSWDIAAGIVMCRKRESKINAAARPLRWDIFAVGKDDDDRAFDFFGGLRKRAGSRTMPQGDPREGRAAGHSSYATKRRLDLGSTL
jgi:hypothetical protein